MKSRKDASLTLPNIPSPDKPSSPTSPVDIQCKEWKEAIALMRRPAWPVIRLLTIIVISTGHKDIGFKDIKRLISEFPDPLEIDGMEYRYPQRIIEPYCSILINNINKLNIDANAEDADSLLEMSVRVTDGNGEFMPYYEAVMAIMQQEILLRELERINSLLCSPCGCDICCKGPFKEDEHQFFEIPLRQEELSLFDLPVIENNHSIKMSPYDMAPFLIKGVPFYKYPDSPMIVRWEKGYSLMLLKNDRCPHLDTNSRCAIYDTRPDTCKRPQIFPYVIEETGDLELVHKAKLLAITDCPYVKALKPYIHRYASLNGLDLMLRNNKF